MSDAKKATGISLLDFKSPQMRAFHMTWAAFFLCFFAWFGIAPLMIVIRKELKLTPDQVGNIIIASVAATIIARLVIGKICDKYGPRLAYTGLLLIGSIPVIGVGLANSYEALLFFRLAIGGIGASFVISQYHTSSMFAPNCVGTANAMAAGIGNAGGGAAQVVMPLVLTAFLWAGATESMSWRLAMVVPGILMILMAGAYWKWTQDRPEGNLRELRASGKLPPAKKGEGTFLSALKDYRVLALAIIYGGCFGVEITIHNICALYFTDTFELSLTTAGLIGGTFGLLALFARGFGGFLGDKFGTIWGLKGRVTCLFMALFCEGLMLIIFSQMRALPLAIVSMIIFGFFVHVSCGATYAIIPFVNRKAIGSVSGIVGAGGNVGAVLTGFLFKGAIAWPTALLVLGSVVTLVAFLALLVRFSPEAEVAIREELASKTPVTPPAASMLPAT